MPKNNGRRRNRSHNNAAKTTTPGGETWHDFNEAFPNTHAQEPQSSGTYLGSHPVVDYNSTCNNQGSFQPRPNPFKSSRKPTFTECPPWDFQSHRSGTQNRFLPFNSSLLKADPITPKILQCIAVGKDMVGNFEELLPDTSEMDWERTNTIYWVDQLPGVVKEWKTRS
ncbi:MAG: hypothetical protein M1812_000054 [Candelaria pacifica]|nr:MAG: hypothetical protein M1812_000054 [Candelaria pacifica]